jgi:hypothetical protein
MESDQFDALLPVIVAALAVKIVERQQLMQEEAIACLYASQLYAALENEKTKVWHYSIEKLYTLFEDEQSTGKLELPEY